MLQTMSCQGQKLSFAKVISATLVQLPGTVFCLICMISLTLTHSKTTQGCTFWSCLFWHLSRRAVPYKSYIVFFTSSAGAVAKYCDEHVCVYVSVCLSAKIYPEQHARSLPIFCACSLWPWLGPPPATLRYVMYFRFCDDIIFLLYWAV